MTTPATGFAAAVLPVSAHNINTDTTGLTAGEVRITVKDGDIPGYCAMPKGGTNLPVILVVMEVFGVHEHIKDVCRRLAGAGYLAVAPELYARQGDAGRYTDIQQLFAEIISRVSDAQVMSDLDATAAWAAINGGDTSRMGVTGFCWGGRIVWMYAAHNPVLKAGVAWYGGLVRPVNPMTPTHPIDIAAALTVPVLGLYGAADTGIPMDTVEKMQSALKAANSSSEIHAYPDTPHGFHADYRPTYRREQAQDGWTRMLAWFGKHGVS